MTIRNNRLKYFIFFFAFTLFAWANESCIEGNGKVETLTKTNFSISSFQADGTFNISIIPSKISKLELIAESNILKIIKRDISSKSLKLYPEKSICPTKDIVVKLYTPYIEDIKIFGNIDLDFELNTDLLNMDLQGNINVKGHGEIKKISINSDGSAELSMFDLTTKIANLKSQGILNLEITATKEIIINSDGMTEISLKGDPKITKQSSAGMLDIEKY